MHSLFIHNNTRLLQTSSNTRPITDKVDIASKATAVKQHQQRSSISQMWITKTSANSPGKSSAKPAHDNSHKQPQSALEIWLQNSETQKKEQPLGMLEPSKINDWFDPEDSFSYRDVKHGFSSFSDCDKKDDESDVFSDLIVCPVEDKVEDLIVESNKRTPLAQQVRLNLKHSLIGRALLSSAPVCVGSTDTLGSADGEYDEEDEREKPIIEKGAPPTFAPSSNLAKLLEDDKEMQMRDENADDDSLLFDDGSELSMLAIHTCTYQTPDQSLLLSTLWNSEASDRNVYKPDDSDEEEKDDASIDPKGFEDSISLTDADTMDHFRQSLSSQRNASISSDLLLWQEDDFALRMTDDHSAQILKGKDHGEEMLDELTLELMYSDMQERATTKVEENKTQFVESKKTNLIDYESSCCSEDMPLRHDRIQTFDVQVWASDEDLLDEMDSMEEKNEEIESDDPTTVTESSNSFSIASYSVPLRMKHSLIGRLGQSLLLPLRSNNKNTVTTM